MTARKTAQRVVLIFLLLAVASADNVRQWSRDANSRSNSDWIPLSVPFRDNEPSASAQHEVSTILRPPEPESDRQQRLAQAPRQGRDTPGGPPQFFRDPSQLVRFPNEPAQRFKNPQPQPFPQSFQNQAPLFLPPQPVPPGFPPPALTRPFQPQPIPAFSGTPTASQPSVRPQNNSFVPAGPQDEVQLVYVPVEALQAQKNQNAVQARPNKFKDPEEAFQEQLRQFVQHQGSTSLPNPQQIQEQQRNAQLKEQEERRRIQEQELRQRQEQEQRIREEQVKRQELELKAKKENQLRQEQEVRVQEERRKQEQEKRAKLERERQELFRRQQQQATSSGSQQLFAPSLQAQEQAFQQQLQSTQPPDTTSPAPHQPPLAVYMGNAGRKPAQIDDVLIALKDAHTIPVLDRIPNGKPPQIFVGPLEMTPPEGFAKFELPYLSSLESNRVERKVEDLPFFVAPLSYQPPSGYSKIPFPSPHVGSVVVSHGNRQQRPLSPDPQNPLNEFESQELPSISPAIPLLVNSLQSGRGAKHQRPPVSQQNLIPNQQQFFQPQQVYQQHEQPFIQNSPQFGLPQEHFVQQPPHHFPQQEQQFISQPHFETQQTFGEPQPQFEEDQPITTKAPPTTTEQIVTRRPVSTRGRTRQQTSDISATTPRTRTQAQNIDTQDRRPINRGRRPTSRHRTTTPQPEYEQSFETNDDKIEPQVQSVTTAPQQYLKETSHNVNQFGQAFSQEQPAPHETFAQDQRFIAPNHNRFNAPQQQNPSLLALDETFNQGDQNRGHFPSSTPAYQEAISEQVEIDSASFDLKQDVPIQHSSVRQQDPVRTRNRQEDATPLPQYVSSEAPFHRSRPAVIQPVVSSTPESLLSHSPTPFVPTVAYPTEPPAISPHHVSKGDVGKVNQHNNFPFIPTPLPDYSPQNPVVNNQEIPQTNTDLQANYVESSSEFTTIAPTEETPSTQSNYQTPSRPRGRPAQANEQLESPRHRTRLQNTDLSEQSGGVKQSNQRFRGRGQPSKEESNEDTVTTISPIHRVRGRLPAGRIRTTEPPSLQITVTEPLKRHQASEEYATDSPPQRTRGRFRTADRTRTPAARQQGIRSRQPIKQEEEESLELAKPVRQNIGSTTEASTNESPVYIPDVKFESGFIPSVDVPKQSYSSNTENLETTTLRPGRGRFNNFATGTRGSQRRPQTRIVVEQEATTSSPSSSGRVYTGRGSRRQQATPQPASRVTHVRGSRLRRPNAATTTTELPEEEDEVVPNIQTGVVYAKNPYVTIHRGNNEAQNTANEENINVPDELTQVQENGPRQRTRRPQIQNEEYEDQSALKYNPAPEEPNYQQYYSPSPISVGSAGRQDQQYFTASSPSPQQLVATPVPASNQYLREEAPQQYQQRAEKPQKVRQHANQHFERPVAQQYDADEYEYQPQRQHRTRPRDPARFADLDDPEYGEESQRSEQISIQQLEGALAASLFNKAEADIVAVAPSSIDNINNEDHSNYEKEAEIEDNDNNYTEQSVTTEIPQTATEETLTTLSIEEDQQTTIAEPEPTTAKPAPHSKISEGRRRRVRVRTRKQRPGDVFEVAESQNVASVAANILGHEKIKHKKINEYSSFLYETTVENKRDESTSDNSKHEENTSDNSEVNFTTQSSFTSEIETSTPSSDEEATDSTTDAPVSTTTQQIVTQQPEITTEEITTTEVPETGTPRVLGTSTTTEISLETEICYRGRCVKTKVDADQVPIE